MFHGFSWIFIHFHLFSWISSIFMGTTSHGYGFLARLSATAPEVTICDYPETSRLPRLAAFVHGLYAQRHGHLAGEPTGGEPTGGAHRRRTKVTKCGKKMRFTMVKHGSPEFLRVSGCKVDLPAHESHELQRNINKSRPDAPMAPGYAYRHHRHSRHAADRPAAWGKVAAMQEVLQDAGGFNSESVATCGNLWDVMNQPSWSCLETSSGP